MPKKAAVLGWYGHNSFGDDLILEGIRAQYSDWQIVPMSHLNIKEINNCDLLILGGGELIPDWLYIRQLPRFVRGLSKKLFKRCSWVNKIEVPKIVLGCGVDAEQVTEETVSALEQFNSIGLRDKTSVELLKKHKRLEHKTYLSYDMAFNLKPTIKQVTVDKDLVVVIPTDRNNSIAYKSVDWLINELKSYKKVVFLAFGTEDNNDYRTCELLSKYTKKCVIIRYNQLTLNKVVDIMLWANKIVSYRLHGMLLAHMLGKPYSFYPYHPKLTKNYETLFTVT